MNAHDAEAADTQAHLRAVLSFTDVVFCAGLTWALPHDGDDVFTRYRGCRRPGTNRLIGGGWPQMGYLGGSFNMIDCEVLHAFSVLHALLLASDWVGMALHDLAAVPDQL